MTTWDLVITCGQSQMVGHAYPENPFFGYSGPPGTNPSLSTEWIDDPAKGYPAGWYPVSDPQYPNQPKYTGRNGSSIPMFVNTFSRVTMKKVAVVRSAVDGTSLIDDNATANGTWAPSGALFGNSVALVLNALANLPAGVVIGEAFIITSIGGRDAGGGLDDSGRGKSNPAWSLREDFAAAQTGLLARYKSALTAAGYSAVATKLKLYIEEMYAISGMDPDTCQVVVEGQHLSVDASGGAIQIAFNLGSTFSVASKTLINDGIHYGQPGLDIMGEQYARHILADLGYHAPDPAPVGRTSVQGILLRSLPRIPALPRTFEVGTHTWVCPANVTSIKTTNKAAGGGAKGGSSLSSGGGGGGEGELAVKDNIPVTPGTTYTVVVGAGGVGIDYATAGTATDGGDTTFNGTTSVAKGGKGGGLTLARNGGAGGTGGTGDILTPGVAGGTAANSSGSDGGKGGGTNGGAGGTTGSVAGQPGIVPGGGGGGGKGNSPGGNGAAGAPGRLIIEDST